MASSNEGSDVRIRYEVHPLRPLEDRESRDHELLDEDPESPRDILHEDFLFVLPVALLVLLGVLALVMTFAD